VQYAKLKTLLIYKYLLEYSDEDNPLSTTDLIEMLAEKGVECERKSIYADVKALRDLGCDIISMKAPNRGFFIASRKFELPEVRLLIDAVTSAGFITPGKTKALVKKLESLLSQNQAKHLTARVYCENANKCDNEEIYYIIDCLYDAINQRRLVKFVYKKRNIDKENKKSYTTKTFTVSPYALIWKNDHYYLVCNNAKYDNLMNLRLDRMQKLQILDKPYRHFSEVSEYSYAFDTADYASKMFNMFSGETEEITLVCHLDIREEIIDRFGAKIPLTAVDENHFSTVVKAAVSDGFISWIMQYGNNIKVTSPAHVINSIKLKANCVLSNYKSIF